MVPAYARTSISSTPNAVLHALHPPPRTRRASTRQYPSLTCMNYKADSVSLSGTWGKLQGETCMVSLLVVSVISWVVLSLTARSYLVRTATRSSCLYTFRGAMPHLLATVNNVTGRLSSRILHPKSPSLSRRRRHFACADLTAWRRRCYQDSPSERIARSPC